MKIRSLNAVSSMSARKAAVGALLVLLAPLAVAEDKQKDFGDGIYSPEKGVICDSKGGYCADGTGISMSWTGKFLGNDAVTKFSKMIEGGKFDATVFTMSNGVHCDTGKQKCFKTKNSNEVAEHITKRLYK
jgi:hypothetical protein